MAKTAVIAVTASLVLLIISAAYSASRLVVGIYSLTLNKAALGVLSTLGPLYFVGLALAALGFIAGDSRMRATSAMLIAAYTASYPLLLSPYTSYLPDGTMYGYQSWIVATNGSTKGMKEIIYFLGTWPGAFTFGAILQEITGVWAVRFASLFGAMEPLLLALAGAALAERLGSRRPWLAFLLYPALVWSSQFHFSPQDLNITTLVLLAPALARALEGQIKAWAILSLAIPALLWTHITEVPILALILLVYGIYLVVSRRRVKLAVTVMGIVALSVVAWTLYINFFSSGWVKAMGLEITQSALNVSTYIGFLIDIFTGKAEKTIFFLLQNLEAVYPLRAAMYTAALEGGVIFAGINAVAAAAVYLYAMVKKRDGMAQVASMAVGGVLAVLAIVAAVHTYGNRVAIYAMPFLAGLYAYFLRDRPRLALAIALPLALISLTFSGFTIYWDYAAGNPVTQASYAALAPHIGCAPQWRYYTSVWLISATLAKERGWLLPGCPALYNVDKSDLLFLANDVGMAQYYSGLSYVARGNVVYSDGFNYLVST